MTRSHRIGAGCAILLLALSACASAGALPPGYQDDPTPVRLPAHVDARSSHSVYQYGMSVVETRPLEAALAFRWAGALDPTWAAPLFARRSALLMMDPRFFDVYMEGGRAALRDPRTVQLDSLYLRALQLNPFLDRSLEAVALRYVIKESYRRSYGPMVDEGALGHAIEVYLTGSGVQRRAWLANAEGRYSQAASLYEQALRGRKDRDAVWLRVELGRVLFRAGQPDGARQQLELALEELRRDDLDQERLVRVYRSKALLEHTMGLVYETLNSNEQARSRYAAALQEDLSYHHAHLRLADLAQAAGDTAAARASYQLALQIGPHNPQVLWYAGQGLAALGDSDDAEAAFLTLLDVAPAFALPYHALALLHDERGDAQQAADGYRNFLEIAARDSRQRQHAEERLAALASVSGDGGSR